MKHLRLFPASTLVLAMASGCVHSTNPLDGTWVQSVDEPGVATAKITMNLNADGSVAMTEVVTQWMGDPCTGSVSFSGITWSSTASSLTLSGTPACTGTIQCTSLGPLSCSDVGATSVASGSVGYTLENGNDTLVLQNGSSGPLTFTRGQ
jgi:hypothetical protein